MSLWKRLFGSEKSTDKPDKDNSLKTVPWDVTEWLLQPWTGVDLSPTPGEMGEVLKRIMGGVSPILGGVTDGPSINEGRRLVLRLRERQGWKPEYVPGESGLTVRLLQAGYGPEDIARASFQKEWGSFLKAAGLGKKLES